MEITNKYSAIMKGTAEPWDVEKRWKDGKILPNRSMSGFAVIFAVFWLVLVAGLAGTFVVSFDDPLIGLFSLSLVAPGIFLLAKFFPRMLRERHYRGVHLKTSTIPIPLGQRFEAVLYTGADASQFPAEKVNLEIRLTCNKLIERSTRGDRTGPRFTRHIIWEKNVPVVASFGASETGSVVTASITADVPDSLPETSRLPGEREKYDWRLEAKSQEGLPGFQHEFQLPVYDTRSALDRADAALGLHSTHSTPPGDETLEAPVPKGDMEALNTYINTVWEARCTADRRPNLQRLFRSLVPYTIVHRQSDVAMSFVHVRGDMPVRHIRRGMAVLLLIAAIALAGPATPLFLVASLVLHFMAKAARPVAVALYADSTGLQVDSVDRRKRRSDQYDWNDIGMIAETVFSSFYHDIMVPRPKRRVPTLGLRLPSKREAQGIAAGITAVRDRYRR